MGVANSVHIPILKTMDDIEKLAEDLKNGQDDSPSRRSEPSEIGCDLEKSGRDLFVDRSSGPSLQLRFGFLPSTPPVCRLEGQWLVWEKALDAARGLHLGGGETDERTRRWRQMIRDELEIIYEVSELEHDIGHLRRAHLVLAFLMHFYVHTDKFIDESTPNHRVKIPQAIAVPLCAVSKLLNVPPVLTYADTVLYNWRLIDPANGFTPENIEMAMTFTNTPSEAHFYKTSVLVEVLGSPCLSLMKLAIDEAIVADKLSVARISSTLLLLCSIIDRICDVVAKVREQCDPAVFYWQIRPWFHGGNREMEGVIDTNSQAQWLVTDYGGPSAGQSTLIHALDVFLGVDHTPHGTSKSSSTSPERKSDSGVTNEETFMTRMAAYMPYQHRRFLDELANCLTQSSKKTTFPALPHIATHSVRCLALGSPATSDLRLSYNQCVAALGRLRSTHSKIALLYIVSQSRLPPPEESVFNHSWNQKMKLEAEKPRESASIHVGTGGTDLAIFLKRCRERTSDALIK